MVSDTLPMVPGIDSPVQPMVPSRLSAASGAFHLHGMPTARSSINASEIVTVPPSHFRDRSESPVNRGSIVPSPPMSEGSPVDMDMDMDMSYHTKTGFGFNFEVKEQDRWLPIANVARIMKDALPEHAKVMKEAKECMQECVSEFISFVTSEGMYSSSAPSIVPQLRGSIAAAEKCQQEKRKTMQGEDLLFALTALGFENYAQVLSIYRRGYRRTVHGEIIPDLPRSAQAENSSPTVLVELAPEGTKDTLITKQDGERVDSTVDQRDRYNQSHRQDSEQHAQEADSTSIVDDLLLQWTSLPKLR